MTQASLSESARARADHVDHFERVEDSMARLERELQEAMENEDSVLQRPLRHHRRRHAVKLWVISGGLAALFGIAPTLPAQNPVREAVDYTVSALVQQMPNELPDPPDLGPVIIGNLDATRQPLRPVAMVKALLPTSSSEPDSAGAAAMAGTAPAGQPGGTSVEIPVVKGERVVPTSAPRSNEPTLASTAEAPSAPPPESTLLPVSAPPPAAPTVASAVVVTPVSTPVPSDPPTPVPTTLPTPTPKDKGKDKPAPVPTPTSLPSEPTPLPTGVGSPLPSPTP